MSPKTDKSKTDKPKANKLQWKHNRYSKAFMALLIAASLFFGSRTVYVWVNTQSTNNAYIEAYISNVSSEVTGTLEAVFVQENSLVKEGQIIAKIEDDDYLANFKKAISMLEEAKHGIQIIQQNIKLGLIEQEKSIENHDFAKDALKVAEANYKRTKKLSKDSFATKRNLDHMKIALEQAKNELAQALLSMQAAKENLVLLEIKRLAAMAQRDTATQIVVLAKNALEDTNIRAPIDGMVGNSALRKGNYVRPGVILFSVIPRGRLYVKANFKETQISKFKTGMRTQIILDSEPGTPMMGTIRNISPATGSQFSLLPASNATGNFTKVVQRIGVLIDFTAPDSIRHKIVPGMSTLVKIRIDQE